MRRKASTTHACEWPPSTFLELAFLAQFSSPSFGKGWGGEIRAVAVCLVRVFISAGCFQIDPLLRAIGDCGHCSVSAFPAIVGCSPFLKLKPKVVRLVFFSFFFTFIYLQSSYHCSSLGDSVVDKLRHAVDNKWNNWGRTALSHSYTTINPLWQYWVLLRQFTVKVVIPLQNFLRQGDNPVAPLKICLKKCSHPI